MSFFIATVGAVLTTLLGVFVGGALNHRLQLWSRDRRAEVCALVLRASSNVHHGGRGVEVVLNSLTGPAQAAGLDVLACRGRFIELGRSPRPRAATSADAHRTGTS
ncbi:hypothetical protein OHR68_32800 [Spirillospora sp. NBC_00431]